MKLVINVIDVVNITFLMHDKLEGHHLGGKKIKRDNWYRPENLPLY